MTKHGVRDAPHDAVSEKAGATELQFVHFKVSGADFGIPVDEVKEIIPYGDTARVTAATKAPHGLVELRGISVPLIDIRGRFSLPAQDAPPAKILIVRFEGRIAGIIADTVIDVEYETVGADAGKILMITASELLTPEEKRIFDSPYIADKG